MNITLKLKIDYMIGLAVGYTNMRSNKGYTLIEILVAASLFVMIVAAPTSFVIQAVRAQQKILASQEIIDNMSYVMEYISRDIRMAKRPPDTTCLSSKDNIYEFTAAYGRYGIRYVDYTSKCTWIIIDPFTEPAPLGTYNRLKIYKGANTPNLDFSTGWLWLSPEDYDTSLTIKDSGWTKADNLQPKVTLLIRIQGNRAYSNRPEAMADLRIQTTVSARLLDKN